MRGTYVVCDEYARVKYSLYIIDVGFRDFIEKFRNIRGAQTIVANLNCQEKLFNLEYVAANLVRYSRSSLFKRHTSNKFWYFSAPFRVPFFYSTLLLRVLYGTSCCIVKNVAICYDIRPMKTFN